MLSTAELFDLSIEKVKNACNKFWTDKIQAAFTEKLTVQNAPVIGIDCIAMDGDYLIEQEEYKAYKQTDNICMVTAQITVCNRSNAIMCRENADVMVMCLLQENEIRFSSVYITVKNKELLIAEKDTTSDFYCKKILDNIYDVMLESRNNVFTYDKERYYNLFHEEPRFKNVDQWFWYLCDNLVLKQDLEKLDVFRQVDIDKRIRNNEFVIETSFRIARDCQEIIWIKMTIMFIPDNIKGTAEDVVILLKNCTEEMNEKLQNIEFARIDSLTKIYNRRYAEELIQNRIRDYGKGIFILLDVDKFKNVNDMYGHITGDDLLVKISSNISHQLTSEDIFGRLGGDEFVLFLNRSGNDEADKKRIMDIFETSRFRYSEKNIDMDIHCSAGAIFFDAEDVKNIQFDDLYRRADENLYKAKIAGRNTIYIL